MSNSSASTPPKPDLVSIILEINQLLFQQTLLLSNDTSGQTSKSDTTTKRNECCQRLSANLSFLAACADPKNRRNAKLPPLVPPKGVDSVDELYAKLASVVATRQSPKPTKLSPTQQSTQLQTAKVPTNFPPHPAAQVRTSQSPINGMMSPPGVMPAQLYQQQIQQAHFQQQQRQQQQQQQQQRSVQHQQPQLMMPQQQQQHHQHQQQSQQQQYQQSQQQQHMVPQMRSPMTGANGSAGIYQSAQVMQGSKAPQQMTSTQFVNPYRQEQLRHLQMQTVPGYPQQVGMPVPQSQQQQQQNIPIEYMQAPSPHQMGMGRIAQQQVPQQLHYASPQYQQHQQGQMQMPYYANGAAGYM